MSLFFKRQGQSDNKQLSSDFSVTLFNELNFINDGGLGLTTEILTGVVITLVVSLIAWLGNSFRHRMKDYLNDRKTPKPTSVSEWRKEAEKRRAQPGYKTDEEVLLEAIREYQETGESTTIPKETLEILSLMNKNYPIIPPTKPR